MIIRKTQKKDLPEIEKIYLLSKDFMRNSGNPNQWNGDYPNAKSAEKDMEDGIGFVLEENGEILGVFAFKIGVEPTYDKIFDGDWLNDLPYAFIHRIAVKYQGRGLVNYCFSNCFKIFQNLKIDTHRDNIPMQKALLKNGFKRCGIIYLKNGDERIAFQKI